MSLGPAHEQVPQVICPDAAAAAGGTTGRSRGQSVPRWVPWVSRLLAGSVLGGCEVPPSRGGLGLLAGCFLYVSGLWGVGVGKKLEKLSWFWRRCLLGTWSQESRNFWAFEKNVQLGGGGDGMSSGAAPLLHRPPAPPRPGLSLPWPHPVGRKASLCVSNSGVQGTSHTEWVRCSSQPGQEFEDLGPPCLSRC